MSVFVDEKYLKRLEEIYGAARAFAFRKKPWKSKRRLVKALEAQIDEERRLEALCPARQENESWRYAVITAFCETMDGSGDKEEMDFYREWSLSLLDGWSKLQ